MLTCSLVQHCVCKAPCTGKQLPAKEGAVPRGAKTAKSIKMSTVICEWFGCDVFERTTMMTMTSACLEMMTSLAKGLSKRQTEAFGELLFSPRVFSDRWLCGFADDCAAKRLKLFWLETPCQTAKTLMFVQHQFEDLTQIPCERRAKWIRKNGVP